jgi:hypothetical protein
MTMDVDPRIWNLLSGLALVSGCSSRVTSAEAEATDSLDGESTLDPDSSSDSSPDSSPDSGPECVTDAECPTGYYCNNYGSCEYAGRDGYVVDEALWDCEYDSDCGYLALCGGHNCFEVQLPPECAFMPSRAPALDILVAPLALAFVDVDDDGAHELVVVSPTQLHVFETGSPIPVLYARGIESNVVDGIVGGAFDETPGADLMLLHDDQLHLHASDGMGGLLPASPSPNPFALAHGLAAGEFDGEPSTDLLVWGSVTSGVIYGSGELLQLYEGPVTSASARDLGLPGNGFTLLRDHILRFFDLTGVALETAPLRGDEPRTQASVDVLGETLEVGSSVFDRGEVWTLVEAFDRTTSSQTEEWGVGGTVTQMHAGELDGLDDIDELALIASGELWVRVGGDCLLPVPLDGTAQELAFGDHDGDGDDELAVLTAANTVSLIDVE